MLNVGRRQEYIKWIKDDSNVIYANVVMNIS